MQKHLMLTTVMLAMTAVAACSTVPENSALNEVRNAYSTVQSDPQAIRFAPNELKQAGEAVDRANAAANKKEDEAAVTQLAYLAKQRVAIAQQTTIQKQAEQNLADAVAKRDEIRLGAREEQARRAEQSASSAQQQLALSQQQQREAEARARDLQEQLKDLHAKQTDRGLVVTLGDVLFDTNKASVKSGANPSLQKLADFLRQNPERRVQVEGYTDSTGNADHNLALSDRRANAVRDSLMAKGVGSDRIFARGFGEESPVASNDTSAGRQMNRRVEIVIPNESTNAPSR